MEPPSKKRRHVYVYYLRDPGTGRIRYVGSTINLANRMNVHWNNCRNQQWVDWLRSLYRADREFSVHIVDVVATADRDTAEGFWIKHFLDMGEPLLNRSRAPFELKKLRKRMAAGELTCV